MRLRNANVDFERGVAVPQSPNRCWLTSLAVAFGPVARKEIRRAMRGPSAWAALALSHVVEVLIKTLRLDQAIYPDHALLSTSLYGLGRLDAILADVPVLMQAWPNRAILLRSINPRDHAEVLARPCKRWPMRVVWIVEDVVRHWSERRDACRDRALLAVSGLRHEVHRIIDAAVLARCLTLYHGLYLETYSPFNPDYTPEYIQSLLQDGRLELHTLSDDSGIIAMCALHGTGDILSVPMVGYDQVRPQAEGLYRAIMTVAFEAAQARKVALNLSAGASAFKRNRGAKPVMEYMIVIDDHLPVWRRVGYSCLSAILRACERPLFRSAT